MRRIVIWLSAGLLSVAFTALAFFQAAWLAPLIEAQTAGQLTLGDAEGTLWRGSAFIGAAANGSAPLTPLLPGRFAWRLSPMILLGQVDAGLENPEALSLPVSVTGSWQQGQISPAAITLPAERLAALGAPLNTIQPSGQMRLVWDALQWEHRGGQIELTGLIKLELNDMASRLSPIKPLGAYNLAFDWRGQQADVMLKTLKGPLLLSGVGIFADGRLQFSGKAEAEAGQEERLANLLYLLGQRRMVGGRDIVELELK